MPLKQLAALTERRTALYKQESATRRFKSRAAFALYKGHRHGKSRQAGTREEKAEEGNPEGARHAQHGLDSNLQANAHAASAVFRFFVVTTCAIRVRLCNDALHARRPSTLVLVLPS
jgi:hypothetical protein